MRRKTLRILTAFSAFVWASQAAATELVMVEQLGCHWCERWDAEIAPAYPRTSEGKFAPLRRVDLRDLPPDIEFVSRPVLTPTFVLVDEGAEIARIEGYPGEDFFWPILTQLLTRETDFEVAR